MHFALIAVRGTVKSLSERLTEAFPQLRVVSTERSFATADAAWDWAERTGKFVTVKDWSADNRGTQTCVIFQANDWAVLADLSLTLATDEEALSRLSETFGECVSFLAESTSGTALYSSYKAGSLRRSIRSSDGEIDSVGEPGPEEASINPCQFYVSEVEELIRAHGLGDVEGFPDPATAIGIELEDLTDYSYLTASNSPRVEKKDVSSGSSSRKPWWRFW